jgi:SnoaL-like domain
MMGLSRAAFVVLASMVTASDAALAARLAPEDDAAVRRVVDDYIGLYRKETLEQWKALFLPGFVASFTNEDGSVTSRGLAEFYESQAKGFAAALMSETLHNTRIERVGRLAHVFADFRFTSRGTTRPGRLMLLLIEQNGTFKIAALTFTYHLQP